MIKTRDGDGDEVGSELLEGEIGIWRYRNLRERVVGPVNGLMSTEDGILFVRSGIAA
jgi:hypothetical protein